MCLETRRQTSQYRSEIMQGSDYFSVYQKLSNFPEPLLALPGGIFGSVK